MDVLEPTVAEIEAHVHAAGWDRPPALFALVRAGRFTSDDPQTAARLGIDVLDDQALTPVEQGELPDQPLDELLAGIAWPESVIGCAVSQEIVILPPSAEAELSGPDAGARAAAHPERREARLVAGVLRDGTTAALLRMRPISAADSADSDSADSDSDAVDANSDSADAVDDDRLTGTDLAPNLVAALLATFAD